MPNDRKPADQRVLPLTAMTSSGTTRESIPLPYGSDQPGTRIGRYRLLRPLGHGGMGTVWLASRDDGAFERTVALKLLPASLADSDWHAGFLQERQIHSELQHPNIAAMFDGGLADDNRPYFVMEYVDGRPITQFCDEERLTIRERVQLFLQVLDAAAHAHQRMIVHRDLKPGNILVTQAREVKLLDFGIAKLLGPVGQKALTGQADQAMTLRYAAPEQIRGEPISMATDVYALGVVLYELLTGCLPYVVENERSETLEHSILLTPPMRPSNALATLHNTSAVEAAQRGYERGASLVRIRRELTGDLEHILLKALHKDSTRRYSWAETFASDLSNYLENRPVAARAPSVSYRFGKWLRRHTLAAVSGAVVLVMLIGGLFVLDSERQRANAAAARMEATQAFMVGLFEEADPEHGGGATTSVRDVLSRGATRLEHDLAQEPELRRRLNALIGRLMNAIGDYRYAEPVLRSALSDSAVQQGDDSGSAEARMQLAQSVQHQGRFDEAETLWLQVLSQAPAGSMRQADASTGLGRLYALTNRFEEAIAQHEQAITIWRGKGAEHLARLAAALTASAFTLAYADRLDEAQAQLHEAVAILRVPGHSSVQLGHTLYQLGSVERNLGDHDGARRELTHAVELLAASLGADHESTLNARRLLADVIDEQGDVETARLQLQQILGDATKRYGEEARVSAEIANSLATVALRQGHYAEAEAGFRIVVRVLEREFGATHLETAIARNNLSNVLFEEARFSEAEDALRQALDAIAAVTGDGSSDHAITLFALARLQRFQGDVEGARASLRHVERVLTDVFGADHTRVQRAKLALVTLALDQQDERPEALLTTLEQIEAELGDSSRRSRVARVELLVARARALEMQDDVVGAERVLGEALVLAEEIWPDGSRPRTEALIELGGLLHRQGNVAGARQRLLEAEAANSHRQPLSPHSEAVRQRLVAQ